MLRFNSGFVGYDVDRTFNFAGSDIEPLFLQHLETMPSDWYYRQRPITYKFNKVGHRSKNIEEIDLDNYILFTGCSLSIGIGNYLEDCFSYQVAKSLNMDYYNLSIGGTGLDVMFHNISMWFATVKKAPKYIVWQWTDSHRYVAEASNELLLCRGLWGRTIEVEKFISTGDRANFFKSREFLISTYIRNLGIPIIELTFQEDNSPDKIYYPRLDYARDNQHYGMLSNKNMAEIILSKIQN